MSKPPNIILDYQVGACIGKGAYGAVYQGVNIVTGDFVAIKQVKLSNIPKDQLGGIMTEIDLLKKLKHDNIVKYIGYSKTKDSLNIVLEYVENGSLQSIVSKFGRFPETLVRVYIKQVLEGLLYLHNQGVIHRDIKGANILTTKKGHVKLADFGVAVDKLHAASDTNDVVGTPYWMAPEIIELAGASPQSDIWSVGCTVIELLTGEPPYFDLAPMPALFRIVQDDHPPLPPDVSSALKDFLMQCFQKDPLLRINAQGLLKHPWVRSGAKREKKAVATPVPTTFEEVERDIKAYNEQIEENKRKSVFFGRGQLGELAGLSQKAKKASTPARSPAKARPTRRTPVAKRESFVEAEEESWDDIDWDAPPKEVAKPKAKAKTERKSKSREAGGKGGKKVAKKARAKVVPEEEELDWDADFEDVPAAPVAAKKKAGGKRERERKKREGEKEKERVAKKKAAKEEKKAPAKVDLSAFREEEEDDDWGDFDLSPSPAPSNQSQSSGCDSRKGSESFREGDSGDDFGDGFDDDGFGEGFGDGFDDGFGDDFGDGLAAKLQQKMSQQAELDPFDDDEEDFDEIFDDEDFETSAYSDQMTAEVLKMLELLDPSNTSVGGDVLSTARELTAIFRDHPDEKSRMIRYSGVIPVLEILEGTKMNHLHCVLQLVNEIIRENPEIQENICLVGGIPAILKYTTPVYNKAIRLETARFVKQMCGSSNLTHQMFIACRGLPILVSFLKTNNYKSDKDLVWMAIDGIQSVFSLHSPTPKNDFCRLFSKCDAPKHLAQALVYTIRDSAASEYMGKVVDLLLLFSSGDKVVKRNMADDSPRGVLSLMFQGMGMLRKCAPNLLVKMVKCVRQLSMDTNTLTPLENVKAIPQLVDMFEVTGDCAAEMGNQLVTALYNLTRIDRGRQEQAALAGIIPHLMSFINSNSPLKQFALSILLDFGHVTQARGELWKNDGAEYFVALLSEDNWKSNVLDSLGAWLTDETERMEAVLEREANLQRLVNVFTATSNMAFANVVEPFLRICHTSKRLSVALADSREFVPSLLERLAWHHPALVRLNLMKILVTLHEAHPQPQQMAAKHNLVPIVEELTDDQQSVLIQELAIKLLASIQAQ
mmetsp:Transcript_1064/g.3807  ORF Transcript_1064/g.3807 Transcript_1064/m.3807 type:complete len:1109 (+) Transcript_1064:54-3380(+)